jgi:hypothetical protein
VEGEARRDARRTSRAIWSGSPKRAGIQSARPCGIAKVALEVGELPLKVRIEALRRAIKDVFGEHALLHRCHRHNECILCDLLPERDRRAILVKIRGARAVTDPALAEQRLEQLPCGLERTWPDAIGSRREALEDTLTLMRLGSGGRLAKTLHSTNP